MGIFSTISFGRFVSSSCATASFDALRSGPAAPQPRLDEPYPKTNRPLTLSVAAEHRAPNHSAAARTRACFRMNPSDSVGQGRACSTPVKG